MLAKGIPENVRKLVIERIDSVPELEAILLLRRHRGRSWAASDAGLRLYVSSDAAAQILATLCQRGIAAQHGGLYRYAPEDAELERCLEDLAITYASDLIALTHMIHSKANTPREVGETSSE